MINPYFIGFEILVFGLFLLCLRHAYHHGWPQVGPLIAGALFGVLLEWATIRQLNAYHYGRFTLMIGDVPIVIGVAWGTIIYSARLFSAATSLPAWAHPILNALLALNIDLSMDALAIRLGMWDWGIGSHGYFGVPYANFWAWFWVVYSFSLGLYLFSARPRLAPLAALGIGLLGVLTSNALIVFIVPRNLSLPLILLTLSGALLLILVLHPRRVRPPIDPLTFIVPLGFHLYFLVAGLLSGALFNPPALLIVSLLMAFISLALHQPALRVHPHRTSS